MRPTSPRTLQICSCAVCSPPAKRLDMFWHKIETVKLQLDELPPGIRRLKRLTYPERLAQRFLNCLHHLIYSRSAG